MHRGVPSLGQWDTWIEAEGHSPVPRIFTYWSLSTHLFTNCKVSGTSNYMKIALFWAGIGNK